MLTFDIDGLEEMLRRVVREELQAQHTDWLDSKQAATYIGTSVGQIRNLVHEGNLPARGRRATRSSSGAGTAISTSRRAGRGVDQIQMLADDVTTSKEGLHELSLARPVDKED